MAVLRVYPRARATLAAVLRQGWPKMTGKQSVENADKIIRALHRSGLQVGPAVGFGPGTLGEWTQKTMALDRKTHIRTMPMPRRDAFDGFLEELAKTEERRPWENK